MKKHNRLFALLLAIAMVVTYMPAMAFAEDAESDKAKASEVEQADPVDATVDDETNTTQEELTKEPAVSEKEMMSTASLEDGEIAQSEWLADDVESIEFSPAGDTNRFVFYEGYYPLGFEGGDIIKAHLTDGGEKTLVFTMGGEGPYWWIEEDGAALIDSYEDDNGETQYIMPVMYGNSEEWTLGENSFMVWFGSQSVSHTATVIENPVTAATYEPAGTTSEIRERFTFPIGPEAYSFPYAYGDKLILTIDGQKIEYIYDGDEFFNDDGEAPDAYGDLEYEGLDPDDVAAWEPNKDYDVYLTFAGKRMNAIQVHVIDDPVSDVVFEPQKNTYSVAEMRLNEYEEDGYYYYSLDYQDGDKLTVDWTDGTSSEYTYDSEYEAFVDGNGDSLPYSRYLSDEADAYDDFNDHITPGSYDFIFEYLFHSVAFEISVTESSEEETALLEYKLNAFKELDTKYDAINLEDYLKAQQNEIDEIYDKAYDAIYNATSKEAVDAAMTTFDEEVEAVKTAEEIETLDFGDLPDVSSIPAIKLDKEEEASVTSEEPVVTFAFTAPKSGRYAFQAYGDEDTVGQVRTEDEVIATNDDGVDYNFRVIFVAEEGVTYYLQAKGYDEENLVFQVKVYGSTWFASAKEGEIDFNGEPVSLEVVFEEDDVVPDTIRYTWYDEKDEVISGSESATITVSTGGTYRCEVSDGTNTQTVPFAVNIPSTTQDHMRFKWYSNGVYVGAEMEEDGSTLLKGDVTIPASVTFNDNVERPVTEIEESGFSGATEMTSVNIPSSVTSIGDEAFVNTGLKSITIPETVQNIGEHAIGYNWTSEPMGENDGYSLVPGFVIKGYTDSEAQIYAEANGITFEAITPEENPDEVKANEVSALINALPAGEDVTVEDKADIEAARAAYDALTDKQKALVSEDTKMKLVEAEAGLKDAEDFEAADAVVEMINALPTNVTAADKEAIEAARASYEALTDDQKVFVGIDTLAKLVAAEANLQDAEAVEPVIEQINALPAKDDVTPADKTAIEAARKAYNALTDSQKAKVDTTKLTEAEAALEDAIAVEPVVEKISALPENITTADKTAIEEARAAYNALTDSQKAKVSEETLNKLTAAETALKDAEDEAAAEAVKNKIDALPTSVTTADKADIEAARKAYDALTEAQKAKVDATTLAKLTDAETALKAAIDAEDEAAAEAVKNKIDALPASVTTADRAAIEEARAAYNALTDAQKDKVSTETLAKLTDAEAALREAQNEENRRAEEVRRAAQPKEIQDLPVVKITKPKAGKKKATVKWKKVSKKNLKKIQGIEIQVASDPGFNQIVKSTTAGKKKKSKTIKGLKPKTTYWVRIRAYKNASNGKHVSAWKVKKVKIKK